MKKIFSAFVLSALFCAPCRADPFDLSFPAGLTVKMHGGASGTCAECGLDQGYAFVRFNESVNQSWYAGCANQSFYINTTGSGKLMFQALLLSQLTGKKVTRIIGTTPSPSPYNICIVNWLQIE